MKRSELFVLHDKMQGLKYHSDSKKFSYALIKNIKNIEKEMQILNEVIKPEDDFFKFEQERLNTCRNHAIKDDNGEPILNGDEFQIQNMEEFQKELDPLKEKYRETLNKRQQQIDRYNSMLEDEVNVELIMIGPDDLPEGITANELEDIYPILL